MKYALVDSNNKVINVIIWPYGSFSAPENFQAIQSDSARVGDTYEDGKFISKDGVLR